VLAEGFVEALPGVDERQESAMESNEVLTMRAMAWQRAKGELNAMLATYRPVSGQLGGGGPEQAIDELNAMQDRVQSFIASIDSQMA
jgi:hypothetical protein